MLTLKYIQENKDEVVNRLKVKNFEAAQIVDAIIDLDNKRKATQAEVEILQAEMNSLSKEIGQLFKSGNVDEANQAKERTGELKESIKNLSAQLDATTEELNAQLVQLPNLPHSSVRNNFV